MSAAQQERLRELESSPHRTEEQEVGLLTLAWFTDHAGPGSASPRARDTSLVEIASELSAHVLSPASRLPGFPASQLPPEHRRQPDRERGGLSAGYAPEITGVDPRQGQYDPVGRALRAC
ncbi:hypothetical protein OHA98_21880 [Streptomyces sp. NBC_00654]|uniref:hypothetical protein n=1 Tax=Streptomyces sp. NBC_00654 TaxID=2975799 RepID=UPI002250BA1D|nr:hypothetical protein [Streptomyces sp. NBC_00654]MCX4967365.1 hypothetical protein [Streptomyces sp. NBC_00654]